MRKFIVFIFALFICGTTNAATMCVKLNASKNCSFKSPGYYTSDWTSTCSSVAVSGIGYCSSKDGGTRGTKSSSLTVSDTVEENKYCWCKMVSPAVSSWVFHIGTNTAAICARYCTYYCASIFTDSDFRSAMFSDLH